ncbi:hypothetical protein SDC9_97703 [bioreactor metagenome]|uniref:Uncharacterized protein n=1 Tax=bioreactor metagenome TaxID=1076179 RepID=A0A645AD58_9ZZZZ
MVAVLLLVADRTVCKQDDACKFMIDGVGNGTQGSQLITGDVKKVEKRALDGRMVLNQGGVVCKHGLKKSGDFQRQILNRRVFNPVACLDMQCVILSVGA